MSGSELDVLNYFLVAKVKAIKNTNSYYRRRFNLGAIINIIEVYDHLSLIITRKFNFFHFSNYS